MTEVWILLGLAAVLLVGNVLCLRLMWKATDEFQGWCETAKGIIRGFQKDAERFPFTPCDLCFDVLTKEMENRGVGLDAILRLDEAADILRTLCPSCRESLIELMESKLHLK